MPVQEVDGKWHVVKKDGSLGKRAFSKQSSAEAAQARGRAMAGMAEPVEADEAKLVPARWDSKKESW